MDIFMEINKLSAESNVPQDHNINVCIGKEWYRYPSSFFLPSEKLVGIILLCFYCICFAVNASTNKI